MQLLRTYIREHRIPRRLNQGKLAVSGWLCERTRRNRLQATLHVRQDRPIDRIELIRLAAGVRDRKPLPLKPICNALTSGSPRDQDSPAIRQLPPLVIETVPMEATAITPETQLTVTMTGDAIVVRPQNVGIGRERVDELMQQAAKHYGNARKKLAE